MPTTLITGASSGLGAEMARQFAAHGQDLALAARRLERLEELREKILADHPERRIEVRSLDVLDDEAVFAVFADFAEAFGTVERIVINAGLGKGAPIGVGKHYANKQTAMTNFVAALAQAEAGMQILRRQRSGQLVMISSISAVRGFPRSLTTYAATKAGVASLAEGLRSEMQADPELDVQITTVMPGYIRSEMNEYVKNAPYMVDTEEGVRAMVAAIEAGKDVAMVPTWPWWPLGTAMRHAPLGVVRKLM